MVVCIISNPDDAHAVAVERALIEKNVAVKNWVWADYPSVDRLSYAIASNSVSKHPIVDAPASETTLWIHRGLSPAPGLALHPADVEFVRAESRHMLEGVFAEIARDAFCVNPRGAVAKLRSKISELSLAKRCGLLVPSTLFSNNPVEIRRFFEENNGAVVVKHTSQMHWESALDKSVKMTYTTKVSAHHLGDDAKISSCPSIFQGEIKKAFELRIVFMGGTIFVIKLDSQKDRETLDWRLEWKGTPPCSFFDMPESELNKIQAFISASGLMYGSIDMIVDQRGNYVFLEVNETGQFLWIEDLLPEATLLDCFAEFLASRDPTFEYKKSRKICRWADFGGDLTFSSLQEKMEGHAKRAVSNTIVE